MEGDIFCKLGKGARFNRRRFGGDIDFFAKAKRIPAASAGKSSQISTGLDFFGNGGKPEDHPDPDPAQAPSDGTAQQILMEGAGDEDGERDGSERRARSRDAAPATARDDASASGSDSTSEASEDEEDDEGDAGAVEVFSGEGARPAVTAAGADGDAGAASSDQQAAELNRALRRRLGIKATGSDVPALMTQFASLRDLAKNDAERQAARVLLANVEASAYKEPTPIQMQAIPAMLGGRDVLGVAPTGSGKTAAFLFPMFQRLAAPRKQGVRSLLLAPTQELAAQLRREAQRLSQGKKFRITMLGKAHVTAAQSAGQGQLQCDVLVSTPKRFLHFLRAGGTKFSDLECVVLDEADRLLELGFVEQVDEVIAALATAAPAAQCAMFSATMPEGVEELARSVLNDPVQVKVGARNAGASTVEQRLVFVGREQGKAIAVQNLVKEGLKPPVILFVQSKERAKELHRELAFDGLNVDAIHADRTPAQREDVVKRFRMGSVWMLVATDVMARGVDFKCVNCVINYDFPQSAVSYIHRIGRTGRAGRKGVAITLFTEDDVGMLRTIANVVRLSGSEVPDWMLRLKKMRRSDRKVLAKRPPKRKAISKDVAAARGQRKRKRPAAGSKKDEA